MCLALPTSHGLDPVEEAGGEPGPGDPVCPAAIRRRRLRAGGAVGRRGASGQPDPGRHPGQRIRKTGGIFRGFFLLN